MLLTQQFIDDFTTRITTVDRTARLTASTGIFQKESSIRPLRQALLALPLNQDATWAGVSAQFAPLIQAMSADKQRKYSVAIKFLVKGLSGAGTHMFEDLRPLSVKLTKSQQRYTIPLVQGDAGHGLCLHMCYLWLKEQLQFHVTTKFHRLDVGNVVGSKASRVVATQAMASLAVGDATIIAAGARHGLTLDAKHWTRSFQDIHTSLQNNPDIGALLLTFWGGQHSVAIVRERAGTFQFYDANAGSYRVEVANLQPFLLAYNNDCLPLKWPTYDLAANAHFTEIYSVT